MRSRTTKCPVTIVTGFLGSGKTTLLSHILQEPALSNTAVLVNEFGSIALDHHLLRQVNEHVVLLGRGCACCTRREDLVKTLLELLSLDERGTIAQLDRIIIETSGLADPAPIFFTILTDAVLQHHFFVDRVWTVVDAVNGSLHLECHPEALKQVTSADTMIVTKSDLVSTQAVDNLITRLRIANPTAPIIKAVFGEVDSSALFAVQGMGAAAKEPREMTRSSLAVLREEQEHLSATHSIILTCYAPLDWQAFGLWLSMLLHVHGERILRVKGLLDVNEQGPVLLNGVQHIIHPPEHLDSWPDANHASCVVLISRGIQPQDIATSFRVFLQAFAEEPVPFEVSVQV